MGRFMVAFALVWCLSGCNQIFGIPDVSQSSRVGGSVRGLWDGADGVAVRLQADGVDTLLSVSANEAFRFESLLPPGTSYTVAVATSPAQHTCLVENGAIGVMADSDVMSVSVVCTGPAVNVALSGPWGWTFDPSRETQSFSGSVATQEVALTLSGSAVLRATLDDAPVTLGEPTRWIALPLGTTTMAASFVAGGGLSKTYWLTFERGAQVLEQLAYGKASNTGASDHFGWSVSLSGDTLAVGAYGESSVATDVDGDQTNNSAPFSGAVYVFVRSGGSWSQQAYLKASNTGEHDYFGRSVSLFGDTLAVGAYGEDSAATGVNGNHADNSAPSSGAVYVFIRSGGSWSRQAYLKASNTGVGDFFGESVSLSGDTLAVGAMREASAATGINGNQADDSAPSSGAVYVFARSSGSWSQQAYLKASNTGADDSFGRAVSLSGNTLAVGATGEDSGVNGDQANNSAPLSGAVYVFVRIGGSWSQQAYLKASNTSASAHFGESLSLSGDTLAVGAPHEETTGAVYMFVRSGASWFQQAYLKADTAAYDSFGGSVSLSGDTLAVRETWAVNRRINGKQADNSEPLSGAVYVFVRGGAGWSQQAYLKASNAGAYDLFGLSISLSGDTLVVGTDWEDSDAIGFHGDEANNNAPDSGAIYVFR